MYSNLISQDSSRSGQKGRATKLLQRFFLKRLQHMVAVRRERGPLLGAGDPDLRLLDKAVYSTFCDCLDLGAGEEARAVLKPVEVGGEGAESPEADPN